MTVIFPWTTTLMITIMMITTVMHVIDGSDNNPVYSPCADTKVERSDGFTFGIAFASKESFQPNGTVQLSPCDSRLSLSSNAQISVFRPKVDEISLLSVNSSSFNPDTYGYMVAFAGRKHAARSRPTFVANGTYTVTSFTLVLEFNKGRLQDLYWKKDGCSKCSVSFDFVCPLQPLRPRHLGRLPPHRVQRQPPRLCEWRLTRASPPTRFAGAPDVSVQTLSWEWIVSSSTASTSCCFL
ncbi:uncharacterized protein LOC125469365 [Pyrus x bretschneideri]|uniref:uncharacterized protein LOC125469365 n=1 Tax=Pyrus x bretschneideri TaxID=225117 RepID=UPI0020302E48|nr:uncharacterized protein LOC125469365 [Pyrus x bretschneideri]